MLVGGAEVEVAAPQGPVCTWGSLWGPSRQRRAGQAAPGVRKGCSWHAGCWQGGEEGCSQHAGSWQGGEEGVRPACWVLAGGRGGVRPARWVLAGGRHPQAPLSSAGGPADRESPERSLEALQRERPSLTPNVRLTWGGPVLGRGFLPGDAWGRVWGSKGSLPTALGVQCLEPEAEPLPCTKQWAEGWPGQGCAWAVAATGGLCSVRARQP